MPSSGEGKSFSNNEVMALIEDFRGNIRLIAEDVSSLREDMTEVKDRLSSLEIEIRSLKDVIQVAVPDLTRRVTKLEAKVGA